MKDDCFEMLVEQIKESFGYDEVEAILYAQYLVETGMQVYENDL